MQMKFTKKLQSLILCMMLIAAMALFTTGCNDSTDKDAAPKEQTEEGVQTKEAADEDEAAGKKASEAEDAQSNLQVLGEGSTVFELSVADKEGVETKYEIHTDKKTVGEALLELELIDGEEGEYGLYVKSVGGVTADYDVDGVYWAFYVNDEYAQTGVDSTEIKEGESYSLRMEE